MLCKKCGAQIPDDVAKCEFCNEIFREEAAPADTPPTEVENTEDLESTKVLDVNDTDIEEASDIEEQPAEDLSQRSTHEIFEENAKRRKQHTEQPVVDEKQQQLEEITSRRNQKKIKQKRHKTILIVCICVIVAAAAGAGTFYIRNGGFPSTLIATPAPSSSPIPTLAPVVTPEASPSPSASADPEATDAPSDSSSEGSNSSSSSSTSSGNSGTNWVATGSSSSSSSNTGTSSDSSSEKTTSTEGKASDATNTGKYSGIVSDKINSKLVIGDKVVYDKDSDRYFMTFNMDGTMYYANVSKGSTTEQINGKYITITADATNGSYDKNTVYEISSMTYYSGDYILPDSGTKLLNKSDIQKLTKDELGLARNEIYARHGRKFQMEIYQNYFEDKSWYKVNPNYDYSNDNSNLNSIELSNVSTILSVENTK